jgi:hypothetical protein
MIINLITILCAIALFYIFILIEINILIPFIIYIYDIIIYLGNKLYIINTIKPLYNVCVSEAGSQKENYNVGYVFRMNSNYINKEMNNFLFIILNDIYLEHIHNNTSLYPKILIHIVTFDYYNRKNLYFYRLNEPKTIIFNYKNDFIIENINNIDRTNKKVEIDYLIFIYIEY